VPTSDAGRGATEQVRAMIEAVPLPERIPHAAVLPRNPWNPCTVRARALSPLVESRLPLRDTTTLTQRNVYILPTRPGFMLGATCWCCWWPPSTTSSTWATC
jgi:hypothetical protein